jgi:hypothetical protein
VGAKPVLTGQSLTVPGFAPLKSAAIQQQIHTHTSEQLTLTTGNAGATGKPNTAAARYVRILTVSPVPCV